MLKTSITNLSRLPADFLGAADKMSSKRRICIIVPAHWEALMGGSQYQAKILIENLIPLDRFDIYYLARRVKRDFTPVGYNIVKISDPRWYHRYGYFPDALKLLRILKEIKPDVIYQQVGCAYTGVAAYYAKRSGCKMVWRVTSDKSLQRVAKSNLRELLPDRYVERKILEYGIRNSTKIIVQTEAQAALLEENYDIESAEVIRNFHPLPTEAMEKNSQNTVLWVANFKKLKQPEVFIRLARDLVDTDARFIMIGAPAGGQWQQELDKQISSTENLAYLGVQSQQEVNRLLAAAQLLVNTSQYEGFSNTFIQAWMRRVPVISLKVNPDNLLSDGALGFCADDHYEKLRRQVSYLLGNAEVMARAGSQAQSYAFEHYSEKNVRRLISLLDNP
ncbi:MAG: glycosyltransferase family 4 protein [Gammaproteobacteria bacterium]|nr:glycosyltransferase family 4 protein [Gammaproteobacteria bacterium]